MVRRKPIPTDPRSDPQIWHRHLYLVLCQYWNGLSTAQKTVWESDARRKHITGFNYFMRTELNELGDIVLYLPLNKGSGSVATDFSGKRNHGVIYGASWEDGVFGKCLSFDGIDNYVNLGADPIPQVANQDFTLEAWIKTTTSNVILSTYDAVVPYFHMRVTGGKLYTGGKVTAEAGWNSTDRVDDDVLHHVIASFAMDDDVYIYIDGHEQTNPVSDDITGIQGLLHTGKTLNLGRHPSGIAHFDGLTDEVFIYDGALTAADALLRFNRKELP